MTFMIVGVKKNVPLVIKAVAETKIEGKWISLNIEESIKSLHEVGFQGRAVISDNHPSNVAAFHDLSQKFGDSPNENAITLPIGSESKTIYLFFDSVNLLKNIRNNLLNCKRLIFFHHFLLTSFTTTLTCLEEKCHGNYCMKFTT